MGCKGIRADGGPCRVPDHMVDPETGFCHAHRPGGSEHMRRIAALGGRARTERLSGNWFNVNRLEPLVTLDDAMKRLDLLHVAVLKGKISVRQGDIAARQIRTWIEANRNRNVDQLAGQLRDQLRAIKEENQQLREANRKLTATNAELQRRLRGA